MKLYEIEQAIEDILNQVDEDGMLTDEAMNQLEEIQIEERTKLENIALYIKSEVAESKAIREEEKALADRRRVKENKAERLKKYLSDYLMSKEIKKYETPRAVMTFRKSEQVVITDEADIIKRFPDAVKTKVEISKTEVKNLLKSGEIIDGASLVENQNLQIK